MAFPNSGQIKIFPATVSIISGDWALANDAAPQPDRPVADLQTYYDARTANVAVAPCLRRDTEKPAASGVYVPSGGTYELQFSASSIGIEFYDAGYPGPVAQTLDFLDADFPMGMTITQPAVWINSQTLFGPFRDRNIVSIVFKYFGATIATYAPGTGLLNGNQSSGSFSIIPVPGVTWSFIQVMKAFGVAITCDIVVSGTLGDVRSIITECFILAAYNTGIFQVTSPQENALPGNDIELDSASGVFDNINEDELKVYWDTQDGEEDVNPEFPGWAGGVTIPRNLIFEFTATHIKLRIPQIVNGVKLPYGGRRLMITGTGNNAFFVGEFPLQNYNITLVEGSGLYTLVENQRYDTYYDRGTSPVSTVNLKIPDPNVKTAYFNG